MSQIPGAPKFEAQIPEELMDVWHELSKVERCLLRDQSIQKQQNAWIIQRLTEGDAAIGILKSDVETIKKFRDIITAKWSVVAFVALSILLPLAGLWVSLWASKLFGKTP